MEERHGNICAGAKGFVRDQDKSGTKFNKETDYLFQWCGSNGHPSVFSDKGMDRNISRITFNDGGDASIFLFCNV